MTFRDFEVYGTSRSLASQRWSVVLAIRMIRRINIVVKLVDVHHHTAKILGTQDIYGR